MEELDFFDILKSNFSQSDPLIKDFYFSSLIKFNRPDFIPLYLGYFPNAPISNKEKMVELLNEFQFKELIKYTEIYISGINI